MKHTLRQVILGIHVKWSLHDGHGFPVDVYWVRHEEVTNFRHSLALLYQVQYSTKAQVHITNDASRSIILQKGESQGK